MRNIFTNTLIEIARKNEKLVLLMAEVGYGVVEPFQREFPNRFYNTGISEQNLVLTAAGLALRGYHPVAYSMSSFLPTRAFEMIKDSVCYQNLPVTLVGIGAGVSYGELGSTHHAVEESALMRTLPNIDVIFPADGDGCRAALKYAIAAQKPVYIGLEKIAVKETGNEIVFSEKWKKVRTGNDGALFVCGTLLEDGIVAADKLKEKNIHLSVYKMEAVKPMDYGAIEDACETKNIFVADEHANMCGISAQIAQYIMERGLHKNLENYATVAIPDSFPKEVWRADSLRKKYGLCAEHFINLISNKLENL